MLILLGMELELPSRLYGEGLEPQVKKINNSCRLKLLELLKEKMEPEFDEVMKDPIFSYIMVIQKNDLKFSARLVHSFLCKELMTSKRHEKWFTFARRPLRFGLQEYHAVTSLKVKREKNSGLVTWKDDDGFWSKQIKTNGKINLQIIKKKHLEESNTWTWGDRVRLIYLCVIMGVVMGKDEKVNIPHLYMKLAMDLEKLRNYPWGLYSFDFLLKQIDKQGINWSRRRGPLCGNWRGCAKCSYEDIIGVENLFPEKGILHSFMESHIDGVVLLATDFKLRAPNLRKLAKKKERIKQLILRGKQEKACGPRSKSRKKNVLCQLAASSKGNIDTDMKNFLEGLVQASFTTFGDKFCQQFSDRAIQIGPSMLDDDLAGRIMSASSWLKNYEIDAVMYVFWERTTLKRWNVDCVAFMTCVFSDLIAKDYQNFSKGIKKYNMDPLLLEYGKGELPSHGRTRMLWNVDVDRMYVPVWVNCNHWIALCISFVTRNIQVFDFGGRKKIKEVEAFAQLIPPPASKRRRGSSSSGPAQTQCEDDTIPDISVDHTPDPSMEYLLPPYTGQFDSGAPPLDGTQQQQFA
uniref:Ubiquitin-like protease family profile domain-containing protein n=1 Tax=Brassica oleracea var. oleracea TaxID=109376 RepID=A0A0D3CDV4_BRAOL